MPQGQEPSELARRCQIHSAKMDEEGHHVTSNVLFLAANEIDRLQRELAEALADAKAMHDMYDGVILT